MCLYPKLITNKKYTPTKKNNYTPPYLHDYRVSKVAVGCGKCIECKKQKAREWQIRILEHQKMYKHIYCYTLTFNNQELEKLCKETKLKECNAIATIALRRFLERWRKKYKKSLNHWFITELGHQNTERIHMHGLIFSNEAIDKEEIQNIWKYGNIRLGAWWGLRTINYLIKYVHKVDKDHKNYESVVLCSPGIGSNFLDRIYTKQKYKFDGKNTIEYYILPNGAKISLPIYYRNKLWTEDERERLWINRIEIAKRYVLGIEIRDIDTDQGYRHYQKLLKTAQKTNNKLGFGDDSKQWQKRDYNITLRMLNKRKKTGISLRGENSLFKSLV